MFRAAPKNWWKRPVPEAKRCYRTKGEALKLFIDTNRDVIDNYGGESYKVGTSEFDAVNHKYDASARSIVDAVWAALPSKKPPYCLEDIDIEALNDTSPAHEGGSFRLPDFLSDDQPLYDPDAVRPPPKDWRSRTADWRERNRYSRQAIADECITNKFGTFRCICRNPDTGSFVSCSLKNKLKQEVPF